MKIFLITLILMFISTYFSVFQNELAAQISTQKVSPVRPAEQPKPTPTQPKPQFPEYKPVQPFTQKVEKPMVGQKAYFDLGPGMDFEVFTFEIRSPGVIDIRVEWQGSAKNIHLECGNLALAQRTEKAALTLLSPHRPLSTTVEVKPGEHGIWGIGVRIMDGTATGH